MSEIYDAWIFNKMRKFKKYPSSSIILDRTTQNLGDVDIFIDQQLNAKELTALQEAIKTKLVKLKHYTQCYGMTLTFKPLWHVEDPIDLHRIVQAKLRKSYIWQTKKYILFPEYTQQGNLHYHGIIYDQYQTEFIRCLKWWVRTFGYVKPELVIRDKDKWNNYITKDYGVTGLWTIRNKLFE